MPGVEELREAFKKIESLKKHLAFLDEAGKPFTPPQYLSTGILSLDYITGGGFPVGHYTIVHGPEGAGKSGMLIDPILWAIDHPRINGETLYLALEPKIDTGLLFRLGVPYDKVTIVRSNKDDDDNRHTLTGDVAFDIIRSAIDQFDLIVVDSVGSMSPAVAHLADAGANQYALVARLLSSQLPLVTALLAASDTALVMIDQERASMQTYGAQFKPFGGYAFLYHAALIFRMTLAGLIPPRKGGEGISVRAIVDKNSFGPNRRDAFWDVYFETGVDKVKVAFEFGKSIGVINSHSCKIGELVLNHPGQRGGDDAVARLKEEPDLFTAMYRLVMEGFRAEDDGEE